jgi:ribosome-associated protein
VKTSHEIALIAASAADEKKAVDIVVQEVRETMVICDYFVIATGAIDRQVDAICEAIEEKIRIEAGVKPIGREGLDDLTWVLLDYGDVVVHVFQPEVRDFYRLESLWSDAPIIDLTDAGIVDPVYSERIAKLLERASDRMQNREQPDQPDTSVESDLTID